MRCVWDGNLKTKYQKTFRLNIASAKVLWLCKHLETDSHSWVTWATFFNPFSLASRFLFPVRVPCQNVQKAVHNFTFSFDRSSSNMSWISSFQSSWREWKESCGISSFTCSSSAVSCVRMELKLGLRWGSWSQHSVTRSAHMITTFHHRTSITHLHRAGQRAPIAAFPLQLSQI